MDQVKQLMASTKMKQLMIGTVNPRLALFTGAGAYPRPLFSST